MALFEDDTEIQSLEKCEIAVQRRKIKSKSKAALRMETCAEILDGFGGLPNTDESYEIICNGNFDTIAFMEYVLERTGSIDEIYIATWIINRENAGRLFELIDSGKIGKATFIISTRTKQLRKQDWGFIIEGIIDRKLNIRIVHTHAKVFTCCNHRLKTYITVSGSANWNLNRRIENYTVTNSLDLFKFHKAWMTEVMGLP